MSRLDPEVVTRLRNILTHEYIQVDLSRVARAVPDALAGYTTYVREVATGLTHREPTS